MSRMDPSIWDKIAFWAIVLVTLFVLFSSMANMQGCATAPSTAPLIGACLVDQGGQWLCKDAQGKPYSPVSGQFVCYKLEEEWKPLMNYCKKAPQ
jgi:hypothetical protein